MTRVTILRVVATSLAITSTTLAQTIHLSLPTNPVTTLTETSINPSATDPIISISLITSVPSSSATTCPTVTSTTDICATCVTPECIVESTVTASCGCSEPALTIFDSHPCARGCAGLGGCATMWEVVTATGCDESSQSSGSGSGSVTSSSESESVTSDVTSSASDSASTSESESSGGVTTITSTDTTSAPVSSFSAGPSSSSSVAAAGRLAPFRFR